MAEKQEALLSQRPSSQSIAQERVPCTTSCLLYARHEPGRCSLRAPELVETFPGRVCIYDPKRDFEHLCGWVAFFEGEVNKLREIAADTNGEVWDALMAKWRKKKFAEWLRGGGAIGNGVTCSASQDQSGGHDSRQLQHREPEA